MITKKPEANVVLEFPKERVVRPQLPEVIADRLAKQKIIYASHMVDEEIVMLITHATMNGIDVRTPEFQKGFQITCDLLRGLMYRAMDIQHPMQPQLDELVKAAEIRFQTFNMPIVNYEEVVTEAEEEFDNDPDQA